MKNKIWDKSSGISLYEKIIGFYGFGDIGRNLAKLVRPFGCEVIYTDLKNMSQNDAEYVQFDKLIEKSQILKIFGQNICNGINMSSNLKNECCVMAHLSDC